MYSLLYAFVLFLPSIASAISTTTPPNAPCLTGSCTVRVLNSTSPHGVSSGTVLITGSTSAISDLTPAAGWTILDCDEKSMAQNIRAVCTGDNTTCSHLYQNGAVHTIVRLPDNCGPMSFARIIAEWAHENQTVPDHVSQKLRRRANSTASVRGISMDIDFSKVDPNHHGQVSLAVQGVTGSNTIAHAPPARRAQSVPDFDENPISSNIGNALKSTGKAISRAARAAADNVAIVTEASANDVPPTLPPGLTQPSNGLDLTFDFSKDETISLSVDKSYSVVKEVTQCKPVASFPNPYEANFDVTIEAVVSASIQYEVVAEGTLVPPQMNDFELVIGLDAELDGALNIQAQGGAEVSSGVIQLLQVSLPGLDFPGVLTLDPTFIIKTYLNADVEANANVTMDLAFSLSGAKVYFPPSKGSSTGSFMAKDTDIQLARDPTVTATGNVAAHLIPIIGFDINALGGAAVAGVNVSIDSSAQADLSLAASHTTALYGCAEFYNELVITAEATSSLFDLIDAGTSVSLWAHKYELWNECVTIKREHSRAFAQPPTKRISGQFACSGLNGPGTVQTVISETIPSSQLN